MHELPHVGIIITASSVIEEVQATGLHCFRGEEPQEVQFGVSAISRCDTLTMYSGVFLNLVSSENTRE